MLDVRVQSFLAVVETGSYTAAAKRINLTQPAVTQHIARLEEHYDCRLFSPHGRGVRLTESGHRFLQYAKIQRSNENKLIQDLQGLDPKLRLGSTLSIADYYLPEKLAPLCSEGTLLPHLSVGNTKALLEMLLDGTLDGAFIEGIFDRSLFQSRPFCSPRFVPVAGGSHPLAGKSVTLEDLHSFPLILREKGSGTRAVLEHYLAQQSDTILSFSGVWEVGSFALIKALLKETQGITFCYEAVAARETADGTLTLLSLKNYDMHHEMHFVYPRFSLCHRQLNLFFDRLMETGQNRELQD